MDATYAVMGTRQESDWKVIEEVATSVIGAGALHPLPATTPNQWQNHQPAREDFRGTQWLVKPCRPAAKKEGTFKPDVNLS
jgi:hypothetical protein